MHRRKIFFSFILYMNEWIVENAGQFPVKYSSFTYDRPIKSNSHIGLPFIYDVDNTIECDRFMAEIKNR